MTQLPPATRRLVTAGPLLVILGLTLGLGLGASAELGVYVCVLGFVLGLVGLHRLGRGGPDGGRVG